MADLDALRELHAWMRKENILYARTGELELRLEPQALAAPVRDDDAKQPSQEDRELAALEEMLHSTGVDPAPFLALMKGAHG